MTPQEILELSEPVEQVYTDVVAQLVSNICRHLGQGKELSTQQWEIKKLSELDALTNESIKIIQNASGKSRAEIKRAIAEAMGVGVRDVEKVLKGAERAGAITGIGFTAEQSDALKNLLSNLVKQAEDRANLVNTVMLNSTRNRYVWAVNNTATEEQKLIEKLLSARNADELERQLGKVQTALNVATSSVEVGAESRVQALSRTVKQLAQEGITGYIDAGGHHWSPEAYMNMDIRTTVHNAYVQAQKERAAEYNVSTFQITSHAGARPLCAPYQGKFYSWDGSDGVLEDLHGNKHVYESIHATSYGQPAGIFGINCGHDPVTFVNGYSIPRYEPTRDAEQNAKEYAESQKQRQLERNVRQAKLEAIAQDAAGNKEAFKTAAEKVRQANADYKAYCKETGRTPRNDRLQVYTSEQGNGYNRSMSGKVTGTTRGWKPTTPANVASQATQTANTVVQSKQKDSVELALGITKGKAFSIESSVKKANPNYSQGGAYTINCQRCVQAYELRRRGYNVEAMPKPPAAQNTVCWGSEVFNGYGKSRLDAVGAYTTGQSAKQVKAELAQAPDGARYSIYIQWKNSRSAHVFVAEKENGVVKYYDPQPGNMDASSYFARGKANRFGFFRMDDKPLTTDEAIIKATVKEGT